MSVTEIDHESIEYRQWPVTVDGGVIDPSTDRVEIAVRPVRDPTPRTWIEAEWVTDTSTTPYSHSARILVGADPWVLAAGFYDVWVKLQDDPEAPVLPAGQLLVT